MNPSSGQVLEGTIIRRSGDDGGRDARPPASPTAGAAVPTSESELRRLRASWLAAARSPSTRDARARDLDKWLTFLAALPNPDDPAGPPGVDVLAADGDLINLWQVAMEEGRGESRPLAPATRARRVATISSWYEHLIRSKAMPPYSNPCRGGVVTRPEVSNASQTTSLTSDEAARVIRAAFSRVQECPTRRERVAALRDALLVTVMLCTGLRVTEACSARIEGLGYDRGRRVLRVLRKGGTEHVVALGASAELVDRWLLELGEPREGWLFGTNRNTPLQRGHVYRLLQALKKPAGLPKDFKISPHTLRHSYATVARELGAELGDLQESMDHADPKTTNRYIHTHDRTERSPAHAVSAHLLGAVARGPLAAWPTAV
jgi:site-specific recombinase XerD